MSLIMDPVNPAMPGRHKHDIVETSNHASSLDVGLGREPWATCNGIKLKKPGVTSLILDECIHS